MSFSLSDFRRLRNAVAAGALLLAPTLAHAESAPFANYAGNWSGNGSITIAEGGTERIRCRGSYTASNGGKDLHLSLRCASDSYKFELTSDIAANGGRISGSWSEATRSINCDVQGNIADGQVTALVQTNGYAATFNITTRGNKQTVAINSKGELRAVNISLTRG